MCGIAGYFRMDAAPPVEEALLGRMLHAVAHRGPDDEGVFTDDRVALGFRRLSIIDPAYGRQPCANEDGRIISICNGEIFNYQALRADLIARGHQLRTAGDTEVLVHLYEERGIALLDDLNGQFACAIYDRDRRRLYLARDQFGIAPLFYTIVDGVLFFASEMKALLAHPGLSRRVGLHALDQILALPGIVLVVWLYQRWSSIRTLVLFIGVTALSLLFFFLIDLVNVRISAVTTIGTVALLLSISGVIATLIPYAAEIYPVHLRSTGAGLIAGCSKFGGILGAGLGVAGMFEHFMLSAILIAMPMAVAGWMLARSGIETRGHGLEAIQDAMTTE